MTHEPHDEPAPSPDGGPAFPAEVYIDGSGHTGKYAAGISKRDWFAAHALQGYLASFTSQGAGNVDYAQAAKDCYRAADAMIAARGHL